MTRLNIYMPDELAEKARARGLNISALTQAAVTAELTRSATAEWLEGIPPRPAARIDHASALNALEAERDELGW